MTSGSDPRTDIGTLSGRQTRVKVLVLVLALASAIIGIMPAIAGDTDQVVATVPVGLQPYAVAVNPATHRAYVANMFGDTVTVIKTTDDTVVATVDVDPEGVGWPVAVAVNPNTNRIYAVNWDGAVAVIDGEDNSLEARIQIGSLHGGSPRTAVVNASTNKVYVANYGRGLVHVIEGETASPNFNMEIAAISVNPTGSLDPQTRAISVDPNLDQVYAANGGTGEVSVIDADPSSETYHQVIATFTGLNGPRAISVNPDTGKVYVTNLGSGTVTVINGTTNTLAATVSVGSGPWGLDVNRATNKIYVANSGSNDISVIDGASDAVTATVPAGLGPRAVASISSTTGKTYVGNYDGGSPSTVTVVDATNSATSVNVGTRPFAIGIDALLPSPKIYVANYASSDVSVIDPPGTIASSLATTIDPLPGNATPSPTPSLTGTSESRATIPAQIMKVLYQVDGNDGDWLPAAITSGAGTPSVTWRADVSSPLNPGPHTIYAVALDVTGATISSGVSVSNAVFVGSTASYEFQVGVADTTPPQITNLTPLETHVFEEPVTVDFFATDDMSGVASVIATLNGEPTLAGQTVVLTHLGSNELVVSATDNAGNSDTRTFAFDVSYTVDWLPPMRYIDVSSSYSYTMQDGSTLPVKWVMRDYFGAVVADPQVWLLVSARANPANAAAFYQPAAGQTAGDNNVRLDPATGQYIVNLHTREYPWMLVGGTYDIRIGRGADGRLLSLLAPSDFILAQQGVAKGK